MPSIPQTPIYAHGTAAHTKVKWASWVAGLLAIGCVTFTVAAALHYPFRSQPVSAALAALWAVGAPVWFWYEYYFIYRAEKGGLPDSFEHFKQGQQTAIAIWAGLAAVLGAFAASDFSKEPRKSQTCTFELQQKPQFQAGADAKVPIQELVLKCSEA
jgi:hypothetical protein